MKRLKKNTIYLFLGVIAFTITTIGYSYAIFFSIDSSTLEQQISAGDLQVAFNNSSTSITRNSMLPTSDADGLAASSASTIYLQNNGSTDSTAFFTVKYDYESFTSDADYTADSMLIPLEFLRAAVFVYDDVAGQMVQASDVFTLSELPVYTVDTSNYYNNAYRLYFANIEKSTSGNNAQTYSIKVWLDENAPEYIRDYKLYLNVNVIAQVKDSTSNYNLSGTLNVNSSPVANATISLMNGALKATTDANGNYTFNGIPEALYTLDITTSTTKYETTFKLEEGDELKNSTYVNTHTVNGNTTFSSLAYTYGTSLHKLKEINNIFDNTNEIVLTDGQVLTLPKVYIITGGNNLDINVNIDVDNEGVINLSLGG